MQKLLRKQSPKVKPVLQNTQFQQIKRSYFIYKLFTFDFQALQKILTELWLQENNKNKRYENYLH